MKSSVRTRRAVSLLAALSVHSSITRSDLLQVVDGYNEKSESAFLRRLYDDVQLLRRLGFSITDDESRLALSWPDAPALADSHAERLIRAAYTVGQGFVLERPLRLAVYKLTGHILGPLLGECAFGIAPKSRASVFAAVRSLLSERVAICLRDGTTLAVHGLHFGPDGLEYLGSFEDSRISRFTPSALKLGTGKGTSQHFEPRRRVRLDRAALVGVPERPPFCAAPIPADEFSLIWTIGQALAHRGVTAMPDLRALTALEDSVLAAYLNDLSCANIGAGEYLAFASIRGTRVLFEHETHSDLLAKTFPVTRLEAQAAYAALRLAGENALAAELELALGERSFVHVTAAAAARSERAA